MIYINRIIQEDYENAGNLYTLEVSTEKFEDYSEAYQLLMSLQEIQRERDRQRRFGKQD
jgi:hypothetical protein